MLMNYLTKKLFWYTFDAFIFGLLYYFGVPTNYLIAVGCTYYVVGAVNNLSYTIHRYYRSIGTELLVQSNLLGKIAQVDDKQVAKEIMNQSKVS